jgi:titin
VAIFAAAISNTIGTGDVISGNTGDGIYISDSGTAFNVVWGDDIGTDPTGTLAVPNYDGVVIQNGATYNTIGGNTAFPFRDVISGNTWDGVHIVGNGTSYNAVRDDYIGVTSGGSTALGNGASGVAIYAGASYNTIGSKTAGYGNVISASHQYYGVYISDTGTTGNVVEGDLIGTDSTGTISLANPIGVYIGNGATNNTIGGLTAPTIDVISGNTGDGLDIVNGATGNVVEGDFIGTTSSGTSALGNGGNGVSVTGASSSNTIGAGNVISGNTGDGVYLSDSGTTNNVVEGNFIGTDLTGTNSLSNYDGVYIGSGANNNTIGGTAASDRNIISGNGGDGVHIVSSGNLVEGDYIGLTASGSQQQTNVGNGVAIVGGSSNNTIGGTATGAGNVISGNGLAGVYITGSGTNDNLVEDDYIGTNASGSSAIGNYGGVNIQNGAESNTIGGLTTAAGNVISGNYGDGIMIAGSETGLNVIMGNDIGTDATGQHALPNWNDGVQIENQAGGNTVGAGNIISYNKGNGVEVDGSVLNLIQTDTINNNGENGVYLNGASNNSVVSCTIEGNSQWGILDTGSNNTYTNNTINNNGYGNIG